MTNDSIVRFSPARAGWSLSAIACSFALATTPAQAQPGQRMEVSGTVAPRCWTSADTVSELELLREVAVVRCTQGTPSLTIQVRPQGGATEQPEADSSKRADAPEAAADRHGVEIHVTPLL